MDRRRFLRVAWALAAGGTTASLGMRRRARAEGEARGFLPQVAADGGSAPIVVEPGSVQQVIDAPLEPYGFLGQRLLARDGLWSFSRGVREDDDWRAVRVDGVVSSDAAGLRNSWFLGQMLDGAGAVTSTHFVPLTFGSRTVITRTGANRFHFNTVYDLPADATGERFRGYFFSGVAETVPRILVSRVSDNWQLVRSELQGGDEQRFNLTAEFIKNESYFDTEPAFSHAVSFGDDGSGSPLVVTMDASGDTWIGNALILEKHDDLIYDFREAPNLIEPKATIRDFKLGPSSNQLSFTIETPEAATDFVPVLSWPGLPPTTGQTIKVSVWPGQHMPFIFNLPKPQTDGFAADDFTLGLLGWGRLDGAEARASLVPRPHVLYDDGEGPEIITVVQNPFPSPMDLTGMSADIWVARNDLAGNFESAEGLFAQTLGPGPLPGGRKFRIRRAVWEWSDLQPSGYWPNDVQDAWSQVRTDPSALTDEQLEALRRWGLPTSIRRP